jgi:hypothetical protein
MDTMLLATKILVATSIFFVWVVRYENIVTEFKEYGIPAWLRDLTGILKLTFAAMLLFGQQDTYLPILGSLGIVALMACAQAVHMRADTAGFRRIPSMVLLILSAAIGYVSLTVGN